MRPCSSWISCGPCVLLGPTTCVFCSPARSASTSCCDPCAGRETPTTPSTTCCRSPSRPWLQEDTCGLAAALLEETRAVPAQIPGLASRIAGEVGGFPYYIHHVVDQLDQLRRPPVARGRIVRRGHSCLRLPRPGEPQLLRDTTVFVLRRRRAVAGPGRARHHGRPSVADTPSRSTSICASTVTHR